MKNIYVLSILLMILNFDVFSYQERGDSIIVKTFTFDSITTRRGIFELPPRDQYEKIIMHYTLKCDPRTTRDRFDCGEWDYLTYTVVKDTLGRYDSTELIQHKYILNNQGNSIIYQGDISPYRIIRYNKFRYNIDLKDSRNLYKINDDSQSFTQLLNNKLILKYDLTNSNIEDIGLIKFPINKTLNSEGILKNVRVHIATINGEVIDYSTAKLIYFDDIDFSKLNDFLELPLIEKHSVFVNPKFAIILSAEDGKNLMLKLNPSNTNSYVSFLNENKHIEFSGNNYVEIPKKALSSINNEITISFWAKGDNSLPYNTQIFEAVNNKNQRILNVHLPWSNKRIYWDAGNNGGNYDRIDFEVQDNDFKGDWIHWAFTKNADTGQMKVYKNGEVIHSGDGKNFDMKGIEVFRIGSGATSNGRWTGNLNDFAIWNRELTQEEINQYKVGFLLGIDDMLVHYKFNNYINNNQIQDESKNNINAIAIGLPNLIKTKPNDYYRIHQEILGSVAIEFEDVTLRVEKIESQEEIREDLSLATLLVFDHHSPEKIIPAYQFNDVTRDLRTPTDTLHIIPPYDYFYVYTEDMDFLDSIPTSKTELYQNSQIKWYNPTVDYEIDRFITPYGIGLDLGDDGFMWKVDVTEFAPVLNGFIDLTAGNDQELLDLQFIFIKGTPVRNINTIRRIWGEGGNYSQVVTNDAIPPVDLKLDENSSNFRVLTRSSGHGFGGDVNVTDNCSEFCAREHSLWINGSQEFAWSGWKECGDNPVYPQGGTWILDRTDWCPGAPVTTYRHEINQFVSPGQTVNFDYEIENPEQFNPHGNWVFTGYLVEMGDFNFELDAAISEIISPSNHDEFLRYNPICNNSRVLISNTGKSTINSIEIKWTIDDKFEGTYLWEGEIPTLASREIEIPLDFKAFENIAYSNRKYEVEILKVNGITDNYSKNNNGKSYFNEVDNFFKETKIEMRASNWSAYNMQPPLAYQFNDITKDDNIVTRTQFQNGQEYIEDFELENGCYEYMIQAAEGYGLSYWALNQVTAGFLRFRSGETIFQNVKTEFGNFYYKQFKVANKPELAGIEGNKFEVGEVEENGKRSFVLNLYPKNNLGIEIKRIELANSLVKEFFINSLEPNVTIPHFLNFGDTLKIKMDFEAKRTGIRRLNLIVESNDIAEPTKLIDMIAYVGISSVEGQKEFDFLLYDNPIKTSTFLKINSLLPMKDVSIDLFDLLGNKVKNIGTFQTLTISNEILIDGSGLSRGYYYISVRNRNYIKTMPLILE
jgi:hypothetical protein